MRPASLAPLFADLSGLKGVGPKGARLYARLCGTRIVDLLFHRPVDVVDRRYHPALRYADPERVATLTLRITEHAPPKRPGRPYRIFAEDPGGTPLVITYFGGYRDYLGEMYPTDRPVVVSGLLQRFQGGWTMSHPDYALPVERAGIIPAFDPVYPLTQGLSRGQIRRALREALARVPPLPEWQTETILHARTWPTFAEALRLVHHHAPHEEAKIEGAVGEGLPPEATDLARQRLAYDELLADQLALAVVRRRHRQASGAARPGTGLWQTALRQALPFTLTAGQEDALRSIGEDLASSRRMVRLLQGDVGAGKTIVALLAMLQVAESGGQAVLMAPTEILARQHHARITDLVRPLGLEVALVVGRGGRDESRAARVALAEGRARLAVGTHALFQDEVTIPDLGFVVVDEQHRFGVHQRLGLIEKGKGVDVLAMTATPIPRTLALTAYGDMDVTRLTEKPAGRRPIDTRTVDLQRLDEVIAGVGRAVAQGAQAYWICPLVEETEGLDLAAATDRAAQLATLWGAEHVGLAHGRLPSDERERTLEAFSEGRLRVLVATTVVEVGVDVPGARIIVIEHAERFGLAQLHQLRGRVGRGSEPSTCLLLYASPLGAVAKARLTMARATEDGFRLAEEDLRLRGPGEMLGARQSGLPVFRLADLVRDEDLLAEARAESRRLLEDDPALTSLRGHALRVLLYLFEKDSSLRLLQSG